MTENDSPAKNSFLLLKSFGFLIAILVVMFVLAPFLLLRAANGWLTFDIGLFRFIGFIPMIGGLALLVELAFTFAVYGRGTPAPIMPPQKLVICGPFRHVRNPGYLGALIALMGQALFVETGVVFLFALATAGVFHLFIVYYEEPGLKERFGKEYQEYLKQVPRWLPKLKKA